jgi:hypothetical protein
MSTPAPKNFNAVRSAFMQRVSAPNIPPHALKLAWLIAYRYINRETRLAYPSQETLARDLGIEIRSVRRLLDILERLGLMIASGLGRGNANSYWIDPEKVTPGSAFKGEKRTRKSGLQTPKKADSRVRPTLIREPNRDRACLRTPLSPGRENALTRESDSLDRGVRLDGAPRPDLDPIERPPEPRDLKGTREEENQSAAGAEHDPPSKDEAASAPNRAAAYENDQENNVAAAASAPNGVAALAASPTNVAPPSKNINTSNGPRSGAATNVTPPIASLDHHRAWHELRDVWQRGWSVDDTPKAIAIARQAFECACAEGADPADILAGARVHVAAADAPRYLPALPTWLAAKAWTKPPLRRTRRSAQPPRNGHRRNGKVNVADAFFAIADEDEAREAAAS